MALNESCRPELDLSRPEGLAALYLRVATTLERSAGLADQHAAYLFSKNREQLASVLPVLAEVLVAAAAG